MCRGQLELLTRSDIDMYKFSFIEDKISITAPTWDIIDVLLQVVYVIRW